MNVTPEPDTGEILLRRACPDDLTTIVALERASFSSPWSAFSLRYELARTDALYLMACDGAQVLGYGGMWLMPEEAHVGTLAVFPLARRRGVGEAIMLALLQVAYEDGAHMVVLEYRLSNAPAAALYGKLGFAPNRIRRRYYEDNGEDAVEAILFSLHTPRCQERLASLTGAWKERHGSFRVEL
jgi:ribosomal-protein-alanine N-acetyltransferase